MCNIEVKAGTTLKIFNMFSIMAMVVSIPPSLMDYVTGLKYVFFVFFFITIYCVNFSKKNIE